MTYHEYAWQCKHRPWPYRVAELYLRTTIGALWGVAVFAGLVYITEEPVGTWASYLLIALVFYGWQLATPDKEADVNE